MKNNVYILEEVSFYILARMSIFITNVSKHTPKQKSLFKKYKRKFSYMFVYFDKGTWEYQERICCTDARVCWTRWERRNQTSCWLWKTYIRSENNLFWDIRYYYETYILFIQDFIVDCIDSSVNPNRFSSAILAWNSTKLYRIKKRKRKRTQRPLLSLYLSGHSVSKYDFGWGILTTPPHSLQGSTYSTSSAKLVIFWPTLQQLHRMDRAGIKTY